MNTFTPQRYECYEPGSKFWGQDFYVDEIVQNALLAAVRLNDLRGVELILKRIDPQQLTGYQDTFRAPFLEALGAAQTDLIDLFPTRLSRTEFSSQESTVTLFERVTSPLLNFYLDSSRRTRRGSGSQSRMANRKSLIISTGSLLRGTKITSARPIRATQISFTERSTVK